MSVSQRELFVTVEAGPRGRDEAQASGGDLGDGSSAEPVSSDEHDQYDTVPSYTDGGSSTDAGSTGQTTADESDAAAAAAASDLEVVAAVEASMAVDPLPSNIGKMTVLYLLCERLPEREESTWTVLRATICARRWLRTGTRIAEARSAGTTTQRAMNPFRRRRRRKRPGRRRD